MAPPNHHRSVRYEEDDFDDVTKTALEMEQEQRMVYVMRVCVELIILLSVSQSDL